MKLVGGFVAVLTTVVAAEVGRSFEEIDRIGSGVERRWSRQGDWFDSMVRLNKLRLRGGNGSEFQTKTGNLHKSREACRGLVCVCNSPCGVFIIHDVDGRKLILLVACIFSVIPR